MEKTKKKHSPNMHDGNASPPRPVFYDIFLFEEDATEIARIEALLAEGLAGGFRLRTADQLAEGLQQIHERPPKLVLLSLDLKDSQGLQTLRKFRKNEPDLPVIALGKDSGSNIGLRVVQKGAQDFLYNKDLNPQMLARCINYAYERCGLVQRLRKEQERTKRFLDLTGNIVVVLNPKGRIRFLNQAGADLLEVDAKSVLGKEWFSSFIPLEEKQEAQILFQKLLSSPLKSHISHINAIRTRYGKFRRIAWRSTPIRNEETSELEIVCAGVDISEQEAKDRLIKLQSTALTNTNDGILITNEEGSILWANPAIEALTGYCPAELEGKKPSIFKSGKQDKKFYEKLWNTILAGRVWRGTLINRKKDGSLYTEELSITPIFNENKNIAHFVAVKRDISARIDYEARIKASGRRFQNIFQNAPFAIMELSVEGLCNDASTKAAPIGQIVQSLYITDANKVAQDFFGADSLAQLQKKSFESHFFDSECLVQWLKEQAQKNDPEQLLSCETVLKTLSGANRYVVLTANVSFTEGQGSILMSFADVTEFKEMQLQIRQAAKMATLGEMATGIAHELNQPLHVISISANMIAEELEGACERAFLQERVEKIEKMIERAKGIINHLRNFGHRPTDAFIYYNPNVPVSNALDLLSERLRLHSVSITKELCKNPPKLRGDPNAIEQVYLNLLMNAMDALDENPPEKPKKIHIASKLDTDKKEFKVCFTNNGPPIPLEILDKIFDPFFTTKDVGKGTGLGLSISYRIVESHGGKIRVKSDPKRTSFFLHFPLPNKEEDNNPIDAKEAKKIEWSI